MKWKIKTAILKFRFSISKTSVSIKLVPILHSAATAGQSTAQDYKNWSRWSRGEGVRWLESKVSLLISTLSTVTRYTSLIPLDLLPNIFGLSTRFKVMPLHARSKWGFIDFCISFDVVADDGFHVTEAACYGISGLFRPLKGSVG